MIAASSPVLALSAASSGSQGGALPALSWLSRKLASAAMAAALELLLPSLGVLLTSAVKVLGEAEATGVNTGGGGGARGRLARGPEKEDVSKGVAVT